MDGLGGLTDALNASSRPEMANVSHGDEVNTYLGLGDVKCGGEVTDGIESHVDASTGQTTGLSIEMDLNIPANKMDTVRTCQTVKKMRNSLHKPENRKPKPIHQ